jgi:hypothetical protein
MHFDTDLHDRDLTEEYFRVYEQYPANVIINTFK